jgi:hypothetical protein
MNQPNLLTTCLLTLAVAVAAGGCAKVSLGGKPQASGGDKGAGLLSASKSGNGSGNSADAPLEGYWTIAYKFGDNVGQSSAQLHQQGNQISGSGTDDKSNRAFNISGTIQGNNVQFVKQYEAANAGQAVPPVNYDGKLEMVNDKDYQGPYLSGQYSTTINGQQKSDTWEAQLSNAQGGAQTAGGGQQTQESQPDNNQQANSQPQAPPDGKAPDLSGKWKVAYKSNFKTISSTMFIEQDGDHLTGRGIDKNTNEKFDIEKGWYAFPKITIVRTYKKGKGGAASDRVVQFKGTVEWVNDKDYQGPYLHGETQGGGDWEAQLVR